MLGAQQLLALRLVCVQVSDGNHAVAHGALDAYLAIVGWRLCPRLARLGRLLETIILFKIFKRILGCGVQNFVVPERLLLAMFKQGWQLGCGLDFRLAGLGQGCLTLFGILCS